MSNMPPSQSSERRYQVGCAGMFVQGTQWSTNDLDEAIAGCISPPGCEVLDTQTGKWLGPESMEDIEEARRRLAARPPECGARVQMGLGLLGVYRRCELPLGHAGAHR